MKDTSTAAAIVLALGLVISSCIAAFALRSLGRSIERGAMHAKPRPVRIPGQLTLRVQSLPPMIIRLENSPGGASLKIDTSDKAK